MKIEYDKNGRKLYKFSHSICQGGYVYSHKTKEGGEIIDKEGLRNALGSVAKQFELIDATIKVYSSMFFFFFMLKPSVVPQQVIESIQNSIASFSSWAEEYLWTGVYDLQEDYLRKELEKQGFDYEQG